jgi:hypothetical protein
MDKVLITGLLIIASVTSVAVIIGSVGPTIGRGGQQAKESQLAAANKIATSFTIIDAIPLIGPYPPPPAQANACLGAGHSCSIDIWIKNIGQAEIEPVSELDISLLSSTGEYYRDNITRDANCSYAAGDPTWYALPCGKEIWLPNETLHLRLNAQRNPDRLSVGTHYTVYVTTRNGVQEKFLFQVPQ